MSDSPTKKGFSDSPDVELLSSLNEHYTPDPSEHELNTTPPPTGRRDGNVFLRMLYWEQWLDAKLGIESDAIVRIPPEKRTGTWVQLAFMSVFWAACTMNISCFSTGLIGPDMGLSLGRSIGITIAATIAGSLPVGFCATFGPESGLRQVSISRYSGWWFSMIVAFFNVVCNGGWVVVACITGAQNLSAAVGHSLSVAAGTVIVACISFPFAIFGVKGVVTFSTRSWVVMFAVFLAMYIQNAGKAQLGPSTLTGLDLTGGSLTLFSIVYGSSISWSSIASDYFAMYPVHTSKVTVFLINVFGITVPTAYGMIVGCCYADIMNRNPAWKAGYDGPFQVGGLLNAALHPVQWAKFANVMGMLSSLGVVIISTYSVTLSLQQFARPLQYIPRVIWTVATLVVAAVLAIAGRKALLQVLQSFLGILGYWSSIYVAIVLSEHVVIRRASYKAYDWTLWNTPHRMPIGIAAVFAFACGWGGAVSGMSETWFNGPISRKFGTGGGDVGWAMAFVCASVGFIPARYLERQCFGR